MDEKPTRTESDTLGKMEIPSGALWGIHTARAISNFPLTHRRIHPALIHAYGNVKLACASTNIALGFIPDKIKANAIEQACGELAAGLLDEHIIIDALQGGAGTSTNMNVNEVIANRANVLMGFKPGDYDRVYPLGDINLHQSTNDTYPTALRLAAITLLRGLEKNVLALQEAFQKKEKQFAHIVKVGRTEMQDAVLTTLGRSMSAYAEAMTRDRWRIYKCEERLRVVNLGGTAIGTGVGAPRQYIFRVTDTLREITGIGFARAENLVEATQNADVFVEVSGILKALAVSLMKISSDLRFMSSGPDAGIGELKLPPMQEGSTIMPGKFNPVIPEAVTQATISVMGSDQEIAIACGMGNLELNPFLPLVADALLGSIDLLANACEMLKAGCVEGMEADESRARSHIKGSTASATALLAVLSHEEAVSVAEEARREKTGIREIVLKRKLMTEEEFDRLVSPEAFCRLGSK